MIATSVLVWFVITIVMMAFFAGIEMAFFSVNKLIIELKRKQGRAGAQQMDAVADHRLVDLTAVEEGAEV